MQSKAERREEPNNLPGQRNRDVVSARPREDIAALVERAKSADTSLGSETLAYAVVDHIQAEAIENATGLDVRGFTHVLDTPAIRHILAEHGNETRMGQMLVMAADFQSLTEVVTTPDKIEAGGKSRQGLDTLRLQKRVNGHVIVLEEVRTKRRRLVPKTMYKYSAENITPVGKITEAASRRSDASVASATEAPLSTTETLPGTPPLDVSILQVLPPGKPALHKVRR